MQNCRYGAESPLDNVGTQLFSCGFARVFQRYILKARLNGVPQVAGRIDFCVLRCEFGAFRPIRS